MDDWRNRMKAELAAKGVKTTILSNSLGYSREYIGRMMKKDSNPGITDLLRVCDAADISFVYVFTGKRENPAFDGVFNEMSKLTQKELKVLKKHLQSEPMQAEALEDPGKI